MKITKVEAIPVSRYLFAKVHTDEGITGVGESGAWGHLEASEAAINKFANYLVGQDPLLIEHHYQYMFRFSHFRGAAIYGAGRQPQTHGLDFLVCHGLRLADQRPGHANGRGLCGLWRLGLGESR